MRDLGPPTADDVNALASSLRGRLVRSLDTLARFVNGPVEITDTMRDERISVLSLHVPGDYKFTRLSEIKSPALIMKYITVAEKIIGDIEQIIATSPWT